jgi:phosphate-selective porin OprO and OprP
MLFSLQMERFPFQLIVCCALLAIPNSGWAQSDAPSFAPIHQAGYPAGYRLDDDSISMDQVVNRLERVEEALRVIQRKQLSSGEADSLLPGESSEGSPTSFASDDFTGSLSERIAALEKDQKKRADSDAKKKADDASKPTMKINGRLHLDYWAFPYTDAGANAFETGDATDSVDDRFLLRRVRLEISGTIPDNMVYRMQVDFNTPNDPQIKDVYLGWEELPLLQTVLVGNQKRPYGLDSINSTRFNIFMERPAVIDAFNPEYRRFGICAYGQSEDLAFNWRYGAFIGQDLQGIGIAQATPIAESYQAEFDARLANTIWYDEPSGGRYFAHWGLAGVIANTDGNAGAASTARFRSRPEARTASRWEDTGVILNATNYEIFGVEGLINLGPLQVVSEFQQVAVQRSGGSDLSFQGEYAYVSYFLTGESMTWDRATGQIGRATPFENFFLVRSHDDRICGGWGAWQVAARFDHVDLTDSNIQGGVMDSFTLGLNWYWNAYSKLQVNYILGEIQNHRPVDGQTAANFQIIGTRFVCDF